MKNKIFIIFVIIFCFLFIQKVDAKYFYKNEKNILLIKNADNILPTINGRNYNVYDEKFNNDVRIDFSDNIGIKSSNYYFNASLKDFSNNKNKFENGCIFNSSGFYKIEVIDLYNNVTEYTFMIDKEVNEKV